MTKQKKKTKQRSKSFWKTIEIVSPQDTRKNADIKRIINILADKLGQGAYGSVNSKESFTMKSMSQ